MLCNSRRRICEDVGRDVGLLVQYAVIQISQVPSRSRSQRTAHFLLHRASSIQRTIPTNASIINYSTMSAPTLMTLPVELRLIILRDVLSTKKPLRRLPTLHHRSTYRIVPTAPLAVCKQLHCEALEVLYSKSRFELELFPFSSITDKTKETYFDNRLPPAYARHHVRHFQVNALNRVNANAMDASLVRKTAESIARLQQPEFSSLRNVKLVLEYWYFQRTTLAVIEELTKRLHESGANARKIVIIGLDDFRNEKSSVEEILYRQTEDQGESPMAARRSSFVVRGASCTHGIRRKSRMDIMAQPQMTAV